MKFLSLFFGLIILITIAFSSYAYRSVNATELKKIRLVRSESQNVIGDAKRGEYVASAGGCIACHTNVDKGGKPLAGGVSIKTEFGTFYSPNITSDKMSGIGQWDTEDFLVAMSVGRSPDNKHYFPAFPYPAYSVMSIQELVDLKAWLDTVEPVASDTPDHDVVWPISVRSGLLFWKALFFEPLRTIETSDRGSYLVNGPSHCSECHSPRNLMGGLKTRALTGNSRGPDGAPVPGVTHVDLLQWSVEDLELFLEVGITPTGDFTGGHMTDVIEYGTSQLSNQDRTAIAQYLLSEANSP